MRGVGGALPAVQEVRRRGGLLGLLMMAYGERRKRPADGSTGLWLERQDVCVAVSFAGSGVESSVLNISLKCL